MGGQRLDHLRILGSDVPDGQSLKLRKVHHLGRLDVRDAGNRARRRLLASKDWLQNPGVQISVSGVCDCLIEPLAHLDLLDRGIHVPLLKQLKKPLANQARVHWRRFLILTRSHQRSNSVCLFPGKALVSLDSVLAFGGPQPLTLESLGSLESVLLGIDDLLVLLLDDLLLELGNLHLFGVRNTHPDAISPELAFAFGERFIPGDLLVGLNGALLQLGIAHALRVIVGEYSTDLPREIATTAQALVVNLLSTLL